MKDETGMPSGKSEGEEWDRENGSKFEAGSTGHRMRVHAKGLVSAIFRCEREVLLICVNLVRQDD